MLKFLKLDISDNLQSTLNLHEIEWLMQQPNTTFDRMPPILDCITGMEIMVVQNLNKTDHIVHGTQGTLYAILFPNNTEFTEMTDMDIQMDVRVPNKDPTYLLITVKNPKFKPWHGLPENVYPICK
jgi:hypothetical protein